MLIEEPECKGLGGSSRPHLRETDRGRHRDLIDSIVTEETIAVREKDVEKDRCAMRVVIVDSDAKLLY